MAIGIGIGIPFKRGGLWSLKPAARGLLYNTDFDSLSGWTNDSTFSSVADDALIAFDPLPVYFSPLAIYDQLGCREGMLYREGNNLYFFYDASDDIINYVTYWAVSINGGKTWMRNGIFGSGFSKGGGGTWATTAMGWICKIGNKYYHYKFYNENVGMPNYPHLGTGTSYGGEIWSADTLDGAWTYEAVVPNFTGKWADHNSIPGSIIKVNLVYYHFFQGFTVTTHCKIGITYSNNPKDTWILIEPEILNSTILGDSREPENPKVFYHPLLQKYVCICNLIAASLTLTDQNAIQISSSVSDWSSASLRRFQGLTPMDATTLKPVGVITPLMGIDNTVISGNNNFIPAIYDCEGNYMTPAYHYGRNEKIVLLEPSRNALRFDGSTSGAIRKTQTNSNFVAEFGVQFDSYTASELIGFIFRSDGTGNNEYILQVQNGGAKLKLIKVVSGTPSTIQLATASLTTTLQMINRIKVVANGTSIKAYIDGQLQIDTTDAAFSTGTHIGFYGEHGANTDIRLFQLRNSDIVAVNGLPEGTEVELRADGGIVASTALANASGVATFTLNHWPMESFYVNGINYPVSGGIWGGDSYDFSTIGLPACTLNNIVSAIVAEATPTIVTVTFTNDLNVNIIPDVSAFSLAGKTISSCNISGTVLTITVSVAYVYGNTINLVYTRPATNPLRSNPDTSYIDSFTQSVTNNIKIVVSDTFTDANSTHLPDHTMDIGSGWVGSDLMIILGNKAVKGSGVGIADVVTSAGISDVEVSADILMPAELNYASGLLMRYKSGTEYWAIYMERDTGGIPYFKLLEYTTNRQQTAITQENNVTKNLKVTLSNESIIAYWGTTQVINYATAVQWKTEAKFGIQSYIDLSYKQVFFDNFLVKSL
jgi:hypothetical protein